MRGLSAEAGFRLHSPGGPVSVHDAEYPEGARPELQWHANRRADHAEVEADVEKLEATDADEKPDAFHVVAQIEMAAPGNDRERCREGGVLSRHGPSRLIAGRRLIATRGKSAAPRAWSGRIGQYGTASSAEKLGCHL